jgi:hypothetical protein
MSHLHALQVKEGSNGTRQRSQRDVSRSGHLDGLGFCDNQFKRPG